MGRYKDGRPMARARTGRRPRGDQTSIEIENLPEVKSYAALKRKSITDVVNEGIKLVMKQDPLPEKPKRVR